MSEVRNKELYDYIVENYVTCKCTQQDVADHFGLTLGGIKNFCWRWNITKDTDARNKKIEELRKQGKTLREIALDFGLSNQNISNILIKRGVTKNA